MSPHLDMGLLRDIAAFLGFVGKAILLNCPGQSDGATTVHDANGKILTEERFVALTFAEGSNSIDLVADEKVLQGLI